MFGHGLYFAGWIMHAVAAVCVSTDDYFVRPAVTGLSDATRIVQQYHIHDRSPDGSFGITRRLAVGCGWFSRDIGAKKHLRLREFGKIIRFKRINIHASGVNRWCKQDFIIGNSYETFVPFRIPTECLESLGCDECPPTESILFIVSKCIKWSHGDSLKKF